MRLLGADAFPDGDCPPGVNRAMEEMWQRCQAAADSPKTVTFYIMDPRGNPVKPWQTLLAAMVLLPLGLWFGSRGLVCFDDAGQWWRGRVKDSFVEAQARVEEVSATRVKSRSLTVAIEIIVVAHYPVDGIEHRMVDVMEKFGALYGRDFERVEAKAKEIRRTLPTTRVFYDPANPGYAVLSKDHLPGFWRGAVLSFFGCIIELMALALLAMGMTPIVIGLGGIASRFLPRRKSNPVLRKRVPPKPEVPEAQTEPPPREPSPLTGNDLADYYSRALRDHALGYWEGFYCEIFLMPDGRIVVVHDETPSHHYVRTWSVEDVLAGRAGVLFDDNQQEARESFDRRIRQQYG